MPVPPIGLILFLLAAEFKNRDHAARVAWLAVVIWRDEQLRATETPTRSDDGADGCPRNWRRFLFSSATQNFRQSTRALLFRGQLERQLLSFAAVDRGRLIH